MLTGLTQRWALNDLWRLLTPRDQAPLLDPRQEAIVGTPEQRMREQARELGIGVLDFRGRPRNIHYPTGPWGWFRDGVKGKNIPIRGRAHGMRKWERITTIMLHQTAVRMTAPRFLGTPCHSAVANDGSIVLCHPSRAYVMGGHAANRFVIHLEISTDDGSISDVQRVAAQLLVRYHVEERRQHCAGPVYIMAHRQSHESRENDPGREIWWKVAVPLMDPGNLGLLPGPVVGTGTPIPDEWWWAPDRRAA